MTPVGPLGNKGVHAARAALALAVLVILGLVVAFLKLPCDPERAGGVSSAAAAWTEPGVLRTVNWAVVKRRGGATVATGSLAKRFRLAGTYFAYDAAGANSERRAVLDDLQANIQHLVAEGDPVGDVKVVRIFGDRVVLRGPAGEEQLWQSFAGGGAATTAAAAAVPESMVRFGGRRIAEKRWIFQRQALLDYYRELTDAPERLLQVFDSLKPVYEGGGITGYRVGVEGEAEFFAAAGLKEGDIVRKVNSMKMTNRRRAEYFIREFVADRANAFVLDVERGGEVRKLIYQVR